MEGTQFGKCAKCGGVSSPPFGYRSIEIKHTMSDDSMRVDAFDLCSECINDVIYFICGDEDDIKS